MLKMLMDEFGVSQAEMARAIERSEAMVSRLVRGETAPSMETVGRILAFLAERSGRKVTFEEAFGDITAAPTDEAVA